MRYRAVVEQVLEEGRVVHQHKESVVIEGEQHYRNVSAFPLVANHLEGVVLRIDDVTQQVYVEDLMLQSAKMASVGGLAAGVAHELNNPLGAMMQGAQMVQILLDGSQAQTQARLHACGVDPEALARYIEVRDLVTYLEGIRDAGRRAGKIVTDLLSFSRKTASYARPHDLNALVEKALGLAATDYDLKKQYDFRDVEIVRELMSDLPELVCDGVQIQQVVLNLVRNAAQAMAEKKRADPEYRPRLVLRTSQVGAWLRLEVENNGPPIPEGVRERLFEPFFTTKTVGEGTGLGLWVSWSIVVKRHGGHIWVEPLGEDGVCFVLELPLDPPAPSAPPAP
jgi:signal transduction histidine kinase